MQLLLPFLALALLAAGCAAPRPAAPARAPDLAGAGVNLAHLDFLGEDVVVRGDTMRLIHIYAEAPDFRFVGDDDEGIACVDDVARAAVVYLRHAELTGSADSRAKAVRLLRFVRHLQAESGLFYNFVWDRTLRINTEHENSVAREVSWWTARAVWALGVGARVLAESHPAEAAAAEAAVRRVEPHLDGLLARYGEVADEGGRPFPQWLIAGTAADATSELLLGLVALERASPTPAGAERVRRFADGIARLRFGDLATFPYGGHASWSGGWHGWGNSQTQALAEAAHAGLVPAAALASAEAEAQTLFARLLVEGFLHEMTYATGASRAFEQIAYDVRPVAVGLVRLAEATGAPSYAVMAGLAGAWFRGANPAGAVMADPATGRGFDGILSPDRINQNAGAESTIEAQFALLEAATLPEAVRWLAATPDPPRDARLDGRPVRLRVFTLAGPAPDRAVVLLDADANRSSVLTGEAAARLLARVTPAL
jgi:hypothetical protein